MMIVNRRALQAALATSALVASAACGQTPAASEAPGQERDLGPRPDQGGSDQGGSDQDRLPDLGQPPDQGLPAPDLGQEPADQAPDATPEASLRLAHGARITRADAFQTILVPLDDAPVARRVPLIAQRDTLIQLHVALEQDAEREVQVELTLSEGPDQPPTLRLTRPATLRPSQANDRGSLVELRLPGEQLWPTTRLQVRLLGQRGAPAQAQGMEPARWPADGQGYALMASDASGALQLVLVPIRYDTDGSGRLPDTSPEQLAIIQGLLRALYPTGRLELSVREPVAWDRSVNWGSFNTMLRELKRQDGQTEAYYYGMIRPAADFASYCRGTCTTGQSFTVSDASSKSYRVGSGVGFSGERWAWTLVHELGHMHGRGHASCGVSLWSRDRSYPHSGGVIGVEAWDPRQDLRLSAQQMTDFMGYCDDLWASDYTYGGIYERMVQVERLRRALSQARATQGPGRYLSWSDHEPPTWAGLAAQGPQDAAELAELGFVDARGLAVGEPERVPLSRGAHDGQRVVIVPEPWPASAVSVWIQVDGERVQAPRP